MKNKLIFVPLLTLFLFSASSAYAAIGGSGSLPYEGWLNTILQSVSGPVAYVISVFSFISSGITLALSGQDMSHFVRYLLYLVLVLSFIIGAKDIVANVMGKSALIVIGG